MFSLIGRIFLISGIAFLTPLEPASAQTLDEKESQLKKLEAQFRANCTASNQTDCEKLLMIGEMFLRLKKQEKSMDITMHVCGVGFLAACVDGFDSFLLCGERGYAERAFKITCTEENLKSEVCIRMQEQLKKEARPMPKDLCLPK